jgi:hypothetical protein
LVLLPESMTRSIKTDSYFDVATFAVRLLASSSIIGNGEPNESADKAW